MTAAANGLYLACMPQHIVQVDSFTSTPFRGNPAAVCVMAGPREPEWMQAVAAEMNLSETAFVHPLDGGYALRWFTPTTEVPLCGHATLAAAHVLWSEHHLNPDRQIRFHTKSGLLVVTRQGELISMDFPALPVEACAPPPGLREALGLEARFVGRDKFHFLIETADEQAVRACAPDFTALARAAREGVTVTAAAGGEYDFVSRFFAPALGINEDPVTGTAHCALGPYWAGKLGKPTLAGYQASQRGGAVQVTVRGERVLLAGRAVTVLRGELAAAESPRHG